MNAFKWAAYTLAGSVALTIAFWTFQPDVKVEPNDEVALNLVEDERIDMNVPVENYAQVLQDFTLKAEIRNHKGKLINQTDTIQYEPGVNYKFVTNRGIPRGNYKAYVVIGYQLNPIRASELNFPLAIIHVEPK